MSSLFYAIGIDYQSTFYFIFVFTLMRQMYYQLFYSDPPAYELPHSVHSLLYLNPLNINYKFT
jgi:hypothetical protein